MENVIRLINDHYILGGTIVAILIILFLVSIVILYGWIKYREFVKEINWRFFASKVRIQAELHRLVTDETHFTPNSRNKILDEIWSNEFDCWGRIYLESDSKCYDLPRSIWQIMRWLMLRRMPSTAEFARALDDGETAGLAVSEKYLILMNNRNLPKRVYHSGQWEFDVAVQKMFPKLTAELILLQDLLMRKRFCE
ncbi:MAG: hypothetical protein WC725_01780 [Patescibacteria group bacterium]|jgi:hypothetical protein